MKNQAINVLQVVGGMNMNGAETFLMNVFRTINRDRFHFYFLCYGNEEYDYEKEINKLGGTIIRIPKPKKVFDIKQIHYIKRIIVKEKIDVVHAHTYYNSIYSIIAAKRARVKTIITHSHSTQNRKVGPIKKIYGEFSKKIINHYSTDLIACGKKAGESLFTKDFTIIENAINLDKFRYSDDNRKWAQKEFNIERNDYVIGQIGRFHEVKNHAFSLKIMKRLNKKYKLLLIGDGFLKNRIESQANESGIGDRVIFAGKRNDVNKIYSAMDVLILPSKYEGIPLCLIEAQANGLPIIASNKIDKEVDIEKQISYFPIDDETPWSDALNARIGKRYEPKKIWDTNYNILRATKALEEFYKSPTSLEAR